MAKNSTNTISDSCEHVDLPLARIIIIIVDCIIAVFSLVGNSLVVLIVCRKKKLRTNVNCFIVSMAVSDLLIPIFGLPIELNEHILRKDGSWITRGWIGDVSCKLFTYAFEVSIAVSTLTMMTIAADRFYTIVFPFKARLITDKARRRLIAAIWIVSIALQGYYLDIKKLDSEGFCEVTWSFHQKKIQHIVMFVFQFALPFTTLALLSIAVVVVLRRDKMVHNVTSDQVKKRTLTNRKITLMLMVVILVFLAAFTLPWAVLIGLFFFNKQVDCALQLAFFPVFSSYSAVNPLVYYIFIDGYRKNIQEILCSFRRCNPKPSITTSIMNRRTEMQSTVRETRV